MTSLGSPGLSSQSVSGFSGRKGLKTPETDWDDKPGKPRLVSPVRFGVFWPKRAYKNAKRTGMTSLGSPDLSSQSVLGFCGRKRPNNPETDWNDNPGKPRLVIPVRFAAFWPKRAKKPEMDWDDLGSPGLSSQSVSGSSGQKTLKQTGMTTLGSPSLSSQSASGLSGRTGPKNPKTDWDDNPGKPRLVIPIRFAFSGRKGPKKPETDWDDNPGKPRLVIPVRFGVFWPIRAKKPRSGLG